MLSGSGNSVRQLRLWLLPSGKLATPIRHLQFGFSNFVSPISFLQFGLSNLDSLIWFLQFGSSDLVSPVWFLRFGSSNLVSQVWFLQFGFSDLVSPFWILQFGFSILIPPIWFLQFVHTGGGVQRVVWRTADRVGGGDWGPRRGYCKVATHLILILCSLFLVSFSLFLFPCSFSLSLLIICSQLMMLTGPTWELPARLWYK